MNKYLAVLAALLLNCSLLCTHLCAQEGLPHIGYIYPASVRPGASTTITVGGQFLEGASHVVFTTGGIKATVVKYKKILDIKQLRQVMRCIERLEVQIKNVEGKKKEQIAKRLKYNKKLLAMQELPDDKQEMKIMLRKLNDPRKQPNAQISEIVTLKLDVDKKTELGECEVRVRTGKGLSNPFYLFIDDLPAINEKLPNTRRRDAMPVETFPVVINGQVMPGEEDWFRFEAKKGQQLVFDVDARKCVPYLADAVPGWFQAVIAVYDEEGKELAYADDYRFDPDPVLFFDVPEDGEYLLSIRDAIHRGREDFVYRIRCGELPFITSIFPLGGLAGKNTKITLNGRNLPKKNLTVKKESSDNSFITVKKEKLVSNPVPFAFSDLPEIFEKESNNDIHSAQALKLPVMINGQVSSPGDHDCFVFKAKAGDSIVVEVIARRLDSPLDSWLELLDANGKIIMTNDDHVDRRYGLVTHHADSVLVHTLPADGKYYIRLLDIQDKGSEAHAYRLRVSARRPDFALRIMPSSITIPRGGTVPVDVEAVRMDGFNGDIHLAFTQDVPEGFSIGSGIIFAGQSRTRVTITAPREIDEGLLEIGLTGQAKVGEKTITRPAVPAEDQMQAFLWRFLVPAHKLYLYLKGKRFYRVTVDTGKEGSIKIPLGQEIKIAIKTPKMNAKAKARAKNVKLVLNDPPRGLSVKESVLVTEKGGAYVVLKADEKVLNAGLKGNLIFNGIFTPGGKDKKKGKERRNKKERIVFVTPAAQFEVVN